MSVKKKHWGEFEDGNEDQLAYMPKSNFSSLIEIAMQPNSENDNIGRGSLVELPIENLSVHTVRLVEHNRQVELAIRSGEVPPPPPPGPVNFQLENKHSFGFIDKEYSWANQKKRPVAPLGATARRRALTQAAAIALASRPGVVSATRVTLDTLADAVDQFLRTLTSTMRTVVDKEASSHSSGFADVMSKVFTELGITGLHKWYVENVLGCYEAAQQGFEENPVAEVPQLHFPASLEELGDSLGPGFQMLHTLESCQLPTLNLLDGDSDNIELNEALADDTSPPVSPTAKKKKKLNP